MGCAKLNYMNNKYIFNHLKKLCLTSLFVASPMVFGQTNGPALEMAAGSGNTVANGPTTASQTIFFQNNTDNAGAGTTFANYVPALSATFAISNVQSGNIINFGQTTTGPVAIYDLMSNQGAPADINFTSAGASVGTGILVATNRAVRLYVQTTPLRTANRPTNSTTEIADLVITFNRPVNNPVIHIGGLGGTSASTPVLGFAGRLDLTSSVGTNVSLARLSGNNNTGFQTSTNSILNGSTAFTATGANSGSGSVRVNGTGITSLTFRISIKGDGANTAVTSWSPNNDATIGEAFTVGFSTLESDIQLTKTVSNNVAAVGSNVTFVVTASNNGPSNNANINITDILPSGYNFGTPATSAGIYTSGTGVWNIPTLNNGASATLTVTGTVLPTGNYNNIATLTSTTVSDSNTENNSATVAKLPDTDGDGIFDNVDLDDDNDGILDTLECTLGSTYFIRWMNTTNNFGPETVPAAYNTFVAGQNSTIGTGLTRVWTVNSAQQVSQVNATTEAAAITNNEYVEYKITTGTRYIGLNQIEYYIAPTTRSDIQYNYTVRVSADNFATNTLVHAPQTYTPGAAGFNNLVNASQIQYLSPNTIYTFRVYFYNVTGGAAASILHDDFKLVGGFECDTDGDNIPNRLDLDSDNDGCFDAVEGDENVLPSQLNANGSINTVATAGFNAQGVPNLVNSGGLADTNGDLGQGPADSQSNATNTQCSDTDNDGIPNNLDLDDDNDGILDLVEDACATEGIPVYSNSFGIGAASTTDDPFVIGHTRTTGDPADGFYIVTSSGARTATHTRTDLTGELDAGNPIITGGSTTGRYLMININSPVTVNQAIYRTNPLTVIAGSRYRFRMDLVGLANGAVDVPDLQITLKDATGNIIATANSGSLGMANDDIWKRLSLNFIANTSSVVLEIVNLQGNNAGGNDVGIDNITLAPLSICDTDNDGIPNSLDLDSDGDGCFDAIEGDENVLPRHLNANGSINSTANGGLGNTFGVNAGIPNLVNTGGAADTTGNLAQGIGDSQNVGVNSQCLDTDGDGYPDNIDLDDDNDGILDCIEKGLTGGTVSTVFQLNGNATQLAANEASLTADIANQAGQMWSRGKIDFGKSFTLSYRANLGSKDATGADGIAAVFHNSPAGLNAAGSTGSGIGAQSIANGLVLEIDTFFNEGTFGDIANDHGQIWVSSNQTATGFLTTATDLGNLEDGAYHNVVIRWNFTTKNLSYTVDGINAGSYTFPSGTPITSYFGGASKVFFGYTASTGGSSNEQKVSFVNLCADLPVELDSDNDGIPNQLDLDSDNDSCFDSLEGDENVILTQLNSDGSINTVTTGGLATTFNMNSGVPNLVNSGGLADIGGDIGQGSGDSQNNLVRGCLCYRKPVLDAGISVPVRNGITSLNRANSGTSDWPGVRQSAWTVLEANTKGFVVNKLAFSDADLNPATPTTPVGIPAGNYVEGMMVYDTVANCLKIYNGTFWNCYSTQSCQ